MVVQERVIFNGREAILVAVAAFFCGALGAATWATTAKSEDLAVDARNNGGDEWTSTHLKVSAGELIEVNAFSNGRWGRLGQLDMRFGNHTVVPISNRGYGRWLGHVYAPGTIQFRVRGDKNEMSGQYRVRVVVVPHFVE